MATKPVIERLNLAGKLAREPLTPRAFKRLKAWHSYPLGLQRPKGNKKQITEQLPARNKKLLAYLFPPPDWERVGKLGAVILGVLYVTGMLTVNTYLYRIGATEFTLLKAQYIYTGALAMAPIILSFLSPLYGMVMLKYPISDRKNSEGTTIRAFISTIDRIFDFKWLRWCHLVTFILLPIGVIEIFVAGAESIVGRLWVSTQIFFISAATGFMGTLLVAFLSVKVDTKKIEKLVAPKPVHAFGILMFLVGYFGWYLSLFTTHIYTNVPGQFGGGKPTINKLLFFPEHVADAQSLEIDIPPDSKLSVPVKLLFETETTYVISTNKNRVAKINRKLIAAMQLVD